MDKGIRSENTLNLFRVLGSGSCLFSSDAILNISNRRRRENVIVVSKSTSARNEICVLSNFFFFSFLKFLVPGPLPRSLKSSRRGAQIRQKKKKRASPRYLNNYFNQTIIVSDVLYIIFRSSFGCFSYGLLGG